MTNPRRDRRDEMDRIEDALAENIISSSETDIIEEIENDYASADEAITRVRGVISKALRTAGRAKLDAARMSIAAASNASITLISSRSLAEKKTLLHTAMSNNPVSNQRLTLAARSADELSERDLDTLLSDLVELGILDQAGKLK